MITEKKISTSIILISIFILLYAYLVKDFFNEDTYNLLSALIEANQIPIEYYKVDFLYFKFSYLKVLLFCLVAISFGTLLFLFTSDSEIKSIVKVWYQKLRVLIGKYVKGSVSRAGNIRTIDYINKEGGAVNDGFQPKDQNNRNNNRPKLEKTEIISLLAIPILIFLSYIYFNDIFLIKDSYNSLIGLPIYEKIVEGKELDVPETMVINAVVSLEKTIQYTGSERSNVFFGLTLFFAILFLGRHLLKGNGKKRKALLVFSSLVILVSVVNLGVVTYVEGVKDKAIIKYTTSTLYNSGY